MIGYTKTEQTGVFRFTPPEILQALGTFDLDPCTSIVRPWDTAQTHFTIDDNGLLRDWFGRVWMNPPWDDLDPWIEKLAGHDNGIALLPGRTYLPVFHSSIFPRADSLLIMQGRPYFYDEQGVKAKGHCGAPTVLVAYGEFNSEALAQSEIKGHHQLLNRVAVLVVAPDKSWRLVVKTVMCKLNEASVERVYQEVEAIAGDKVRKNKHYKEKVRQMLQRHFTRVRKGHYAN